MHSWPWTRPMPVMMPAQGASLSYMSRAASCDSSRNGEPASSRVRTRSRGSSLPRATCLARAASPPPCAPWSIFARKSSTSADIAPALVRNSAERALRLVFSVLMGRRQEEWNRRRYGGPGSRARKKHYSNHPAAGPYPASILYVRAVSIDSVCGSVAAPASAISPLAMLPLDRLAADATRWGAGQLRDEGHMLGFLEAGDTLADELDQIFGAHPFSGLARAHRLDRLPPVRIRHAEHHRFGDRRMFENRAFDFGRIYVLAAGFDQFLGGRAARIPNVTVLVEASHVARVVPAVAKRERVVRIAVPIALKYHRPAHHDLAGLTVGQGLIQVVDHRHGAENRRPPRRSGTVAEWRERHPSRYFRLTVRSTETSVRGSSLEALDGVRLVQAGYHAQAGQVGAGLGRLVEQSPQHRRKF